jgi:biotin transport system substrate-specific component
MQQISRFHTAGDFILTLALHTLEGIDSCHYTKFSRNCTKDRYHRRDKMAETTLSGTGSPLVDRIWAVGEQKRLRQIILAFVGAALLTLSAKIQVPFYPVPVTLQTLVLPLIGAAYGWRLGVATVLLYFAHGFFGAPVFAGMTSGPAYFMGPTGGFLAGFVALVGIVGYGVEKGAARSVFSLTGIILLGKVVLFALGLFWLAHFATMASGGTGVGYSRAFFGAVQPFILGDLLKTGIAVALIAVFARRVG